MNEADDWFYCFVPGYPAAGLKNFTREKDEFGRDTNRWTLQMDANTPVNELAAYVSKPLPEGTALGLYIAAPPFESYHYLGPITNAAPSAVFKTRYVWSAADAVPTSVKIGVVSEHESTLAQRPPERVSNDKGIEVVKIARSIGQDIYSFMSSFATTSIGFDGEQREVLDRPSSVLEKWLTKFNDKCAKQGLDWLK